ncbi:hypothetical protein EC991_000140 [Linnemannia zychae]|nr:hypothetical protein EC991_000140 [Linnemannia zychae]
MSLFTHTSNYHHRISIFDIPHILDLICDSFDSKKELLPCLQVSRAWYRVFRPQVLQHVEFVNLKRHQTWTILSSAARIKSLTVDISDAGWFLNSSSSTSLTFSPCVNLQELHCVDYAYLPKPPAPKLMTVAEIRSPPPTYVDQTKNALLMIEINPKLRTLTIQHQENGYKATHFTEAVFKSLASHKCLTQIHISIPFISSVFRQTLICSLPVSLRDFEFCCWSSNGWDEDRRAGVDTPEFNLKYEAISLPFLERLCLRGPQSRRVSHWQDAFFPSLETPPRERNESTYYSEPEVIGLVRKSPRLKDLVVRNFNGEVKTLLDVLVGSCPDLETIDIAADDVWNNNADDVDVDTGNPDDANRDATATPITEPYFAKLKEFRIEGEWRDSMQAKIAGLVSRSVETLEVAWFDRSYVDYAARTENPFHIDFKTSWTRCTQLKELVLYYPGGFQTTDYCWDAPEGRYSHNFSSSASDVLEDYSNALGRLEKLRLSVKEPYWEECSNEWSPWDACDYDDWNDFPPKTAENIIREREQEKELEKKKREHRIAFVLQVREIYGRLKDLKRLAALEIEWCAGGVVRDMTLEQVLQLFYETEFDEDKDRGIGYERSAEYTRTSKGWWGPVKKADLSWLGLSWPTEAEQQARTDINLKNIISQDQWQPSSVIDTSYARPTDFFSRRVGRVWEDWMYLVGACPKHWSNRNDGWSRGLREARCCCWYLEDWKDVATDGYEALDSNHIVHSRQFEYFCSGMRVDNNMRSSRKANRGRF